MGLPRGVSSDRSSRRGQGYPRSRVAAGPLRPHSQRWGPDDAALLTAAHKSLRVHFRPHRHTVAAALRTDSGRVFTGVCLDGLHSPCAESVAFGRAVMAGEPSIACIVAVNQKGILPPCGNCRQMLIDYAPGARVLLQEGRRRLKLSAEELLPYPFRTFE
jgi:cytidine deaminase